MKVKDGYLFPLVFECSAGFRYTAYIDNDVFRFVSNQSGQVWANDDKFSFEQFKIYVKEGSWKILTPQFDQTTELTEALAKIDTLESALEDAVRELISLREGSNTVVIDVNKEGVKLGEFKPISEMTLEDWELALAEEWQFSLSDGCTDSLNEIDYSDRRYPVGMKMSGWKTLDGFDVYTVECREYDDVNITKRIK